MCVFRGSREINLRMRENEKAGVGNTLSLEDNRFALEGGVKLLEIEYFPTPKKYKTVPTFAIEVGGPLQVFRCSATCFGQRWSFGNFDLGCYATRGMGPDINIPLTQRVTFC